MTQRVARKTSFIVSLMAVWLGSSSAWSQAVTDDEEPASLLSWPGVVALLGGIEATVGGGTASVSSSVTQSGREDQEIASGAASKRSWGISLYSGPIQTGWVLRPTAGFLAQEIAISDFEADLPKTYDDQSWNIDATCSDPVSGAGLDCAAPNVYDLSMRTAYVGAQGGYDAVWGTGWVRPFVGSSINVDAVEYRTVRVSFGDRTEDSDGFALFRSVGGEVTAGAAFPDVRVVVRFVGSFQAYLRFEYDEPLEFRGPVQHDPVQDIFLRPRMFVESASLSVLDAKVAVAYLF
jgi:hypothetical protein